MVETVGSAEAIAVPVPVIDVEEVEEDDALVSVLVVIVTGKAAIVQHACFRSGV